MKKRVVKGKEPQVRGRDERARQLTQKQLADVRGGISIVILNDAGEET